MQSTSPDGSDATSEGIFVFRGSAQVGDSVTVTGDVSEFRPGGGSSTNLTTTEIVSLAVNVVSTGNALPEPVDIGTDRVPPTAVIDDDATGSVETSGSFDATTDGIDFYESMEGMRVSVTDPEVVGPTASFEEIPVVVGGAGPRTTRGGIVVTPGDFNPERVTLDDGQNTASIQMPAADTGDRLAGTVAGVLDYSFANFKLLVDSAPTVLQTGPARETTTPALDDELAMASYNVENLSPADSQAKFDTLAATDRGQPGLARPAHPRGGAGQQRPDQRRCRRGRRDAPAAHRGDHPRRRAGLPVAADQPGEQRRGRRSRAATSGSPSCSGPTAA